MTVHTDRDHGHIRIDIEDDSETVILSILEYRDGGIDTHSIELDYETARILAHYILEHCAELDFPQCTDECRE